MGKVSTKGNTLTPQEYVALFGQFNGTDQATIMKSMKSLWFEASWQKLDKALPDDEVPDDEIISELRAYRNGE